MENKKSDYLREGIIDNPLNIKRVNGDLPTKKGSPKNIMTLIVVGGILSLNLNNAWAITHAIIGSTSFSVIVLGIIYLIIILITMHYTVLDGPRNVKAYRDFLVNKIKDLSIMWEVQDIREMTIRGNKIGYIDYIDSSRCMIICCIPGIVLNHEPRRALHHYTSITKALSLLDDLGYNWDLDTDEQPADETEQLNMYFGALREYGEDTDIDFVSVFSEILDTIKMTVEVTSALNNIYIKVYGFGKQKHNMYEKLTPVIEALKINTSFSSVKFLNAEEIDIWNAADNSVNNYDKEELIMNKYKGSENLGITAVTLARNEKGEVVKEFRENFNIKKLVKITSVPIAKFSPMGSQRIQIGRRGAPPIEIPKPHVENAALTEKEREIGISISNKGRAMKLVELLYSDEKVQLGE